MTKQLALLQPGFVRAATNFVLKRRATRYCVFHGTTAGSCRQRPFSVGCGSAASNRRLVPGSKGHARAREGERLVLHALASGLGLSLIHISEPTRPEPI
eukprot:9385984-Pyramimonas_sp.AAC.1